MAGTRWVKIDTGYLRNPKVTAVSASAVLLHLASILWCADQLTDGNIPATILHQICVMAHVQKRDAQRRADELVKAGLWIPNGIEGWTLHHYEDMNPQAMRAAVEDQRRKWRDAKR